MTLMELGWTIFGGVSLGVWLVICLAIPLYGAAWIDRYLEKYLGKMVAVLLAFSFMVTSLTTGISAGVALLQFLDVFQYQEIFPVGMVVDLVIVVWVAWRVSRLESSKKKQEQEGES